MTTRSPSSPLAETLALRTARGELGEPLAGKPDWVHCYACGHDCRIPPGQPGICKVRFNQDGELRVPRGYVGALQEWRNEHVRQEDVPAGTFGLTFRLAREVPPEASEDAR